MMEFLVITDMGTYDEDIAYCGLCEIEAYKSFKSLKCKHKRVNIVIAEVEKMLIKDIMFINDYKIIKIVK